MAFQTELLRFYQSKMNSDLAGYVSDPEHPDLMPPHTTGGAVDITLSFRGSPLALGTPFDSFSDRAHLWALESAHQTPEDALARGLRRMLAAALVAEGFAPYPLEWWHWSYGEQRWAAQYGFAETLYSPLPVGV
jgi:D-alanyl-D-alanine dipeptidase